MHFWLDKTQNTTDIAKQLLGCLLVTQTEKGKTSGFIVETEAYLGEMDKAAHTYGLRKTPRVNSMYQPAGTVYIYTMHTHNMLNIITKEAGNPQGILVRAIEPYEGIELMECRREGKTGVELTNGPGKLTKAMGITKLDDGTTIGNQSLYLSSKIRRYPRDIMETPRIGIPNKGEWTEAPLRFAVRGNPYISKITKKNRLSNTWL